MKDAKFDFALAIGGAAGQGVATPGNILARMFVRRGLHIHAYNAYQSIIRGGHILLTIRVADVELPCHGDKIDLLMCLNQDTLDRHLPILGPGGRAIYNSDKLEPSEPPEGVTLVPIPVGELTDNNPNKLMQNTAFIGVTTALMGIDFEVLAKAMTEVFKRKGQDVVDLNTGTAKAAFDYTHANFEIFPDPVPSGDEPLAVWSGNDALAMGGAAAGVKFYAAYPMSPATGVLHWMANNARDLDIMVRQIEDEIGVANIVIGAAHAGARAMCATSGGGFALMTEAIGSAAMMEIPVVYINVMRAGPSTGVPTKTEQGDLWQMLGASQGDFQRFIVAPKNALDAFNTIPELFNLCDAAQCPGIVLSDLLISEGTFSVPAKEINMQPEINRGELITEPRFSNDDGLADPATREGGGYKRYKDTENGVSPRALLGLEGYVHVVSTDEHDEDGVLISDEFTNPHKRQMMVEKRARKFESIVDRIAPPELEGPADADVTLLGWGSTWGVIHEACKQLSNAGIIANHLPVKWIVPLYGDEIEEILGRSKRVIIVENNQSGQFARYLRSETGFKANGHIRKYDGEPFMPHHIVAGVQEQLANETEIYVPRHEIMV